MPAEICYYRRIRGIEIGYLGKGAGIRKEENEGRGGMENRGGGIGVRRRWAGELVIGDSGSEEKGGV